MYNKNLKIGSWIYCGSIIESTNNSDAIVILTEWDDFKKLNWELISKRMRSPAWVFDTRSISNANDAKKFGINVWILGSGR